MQRAYLFFEAEKRPMWPRKIGREEEEMRLARQQGLRRGAGQPRGLFEGPWLLLLVKGDGTQYQVLSSGEHELTGPF